jgi:hypothetical protein
MSVKSIDFLFEGTKGDTFYCQVSQSMFFNLTLQIYKSLIMSQRCKQAYVAPPKNLLSSCGIENIRYAYMYTYKYTQNYKREWMVL